MSTDENKTIARRFIQAWSAGGLDIVDELAAPNLTVSYSHFPEPLHGIESFKQILSQTYASFPDIQITADELMAEGDEVMVRWTYHATHQVEVFGIPATGKQVRVSGMTVYRIPYGKVVEESGVIDNFSLMLQLGVIPAPEQE
jgi:steroid delta-isomerase-like uncharacterized protein